MTLRKGAIGLTAAMLLLVGCAAAAPSGDSTSSADADATVDRTVTHTQDKLAASEVDQDSLPFPFQELPTYALNFDQVPRAMDGVLFGLRATDGVLEFAAVDLEGNQLWSVQRPASCSGHTLVRTSGADSGRALAILTDVAGASGKVSALTASAYDLHTGELAWGPAEVSGPLRGPGPIFSTQPGGGAVGETGPADLLDAATGKKSVHEESLEHSLVGSYDGVVLTIDGDQLVATGHATWSVPVAGLLGPGQEPSEGDLSVSALPGTTSPTGYALVRVGAGQVGAVVELATGNVLDTHAVDAAWDADADTLVVHSQPGTGPDALAGFTTGGPAWNRSLEAPMRIAASGGVLTYLRSDTAVQVINAMTGDDAVAYAPESTSFAVPLLIHMGAAVFDLDQLTLTGIHPQM